MGENKIDIPRLIAQLDALNASGQERAAELFLEDKLEKSRRTDDWSGELTVLSELLGQYRRSGSREKGLAAADSAVSMVRAHHLEKTVSGATVLLNAATTLKCFGQAERSIELFEEVNAVYSAKLDPFDYRMAGLYNNMALSYGDMGMADEAERFFRQALEVLARCPQGENDAAVTYCNLAELYDKHDPEDAGIESCMEKAWECLNAPSLPRDGYYAFTASKCAPCFDYFGFFMYAGELRKRAGEIYGTA